MDVGCYTNSYSSDNRTFPVKNSLLAKEVYQVVLVSIKAIAFAKTGVAAKSMNTPKIAGRRLH